MGDSQAKILSRSEPPLSASQLERSLGEALREQVPGVPDPGALIGNKYRIERLIARGGMGAVFAATHIVSGKRVAVKWMLPQLGQIEGARERFIREACATARIAHPNIVDIYDVGSDAGSVYLVMEFLRGETLSQRMSRAPLSEQELVMFLLPALRGVAAAHEHGVVHRDLKPDNIFLCCNAQGEALEPKVLDFGISKITSDEVRDLALTHSGAVLGTPYYMSPEQVRGARDVDGRADVYAFGVMMFEALTGQRPFDADTYNELILKIATEPPPSAAELNPNLEPRLIEVIERAMTREPDERFQTIEELALALEPFAGGMRYRVQRTLVDPAGMSSDFPLARPPSVNSSHDHPRTPLEIVLERRARSRGRLRAAAAALALLACGAVGLYGVRNRYPERAQVARPAPQPMAAAEQVIVPAEPEQPAGTAEVETSVSAAEAIPNAIAPLPAAPAPAAVRGSNPRPSSPKHTSTSARDRHWISEPPAPETLAAPAAPKRVVPKDWDERLPSDSTRTPPSEIPAGRIDAQDFR